MRHTVVVTLDADSVVLHVTSFASRTPACYVKSQHYDESYLWH